MVPVTRLPSSDRGLLTVVEIAFPSQSTFIRLPDTCSVDLPPTPCSTAYSKSKGSCDSDTSLTTATPMNGYSTVTVSLLRELLSLGKKTYFFLFSPSRYCCENIPTLTQLPRTVSWGTTTIPLS